MADTPRLFTVEEANRTLPLISPIVHDLLEEHREWRAAIERFELALAAEPGNDGVEAEVVAAARADAEGRAARIDGLLRELADLGCLFKGFEGGLVDFLSLRNDLPVYLCWRHGEERVAHWHDLEGGFGGRRPIDTHLFSEVT